jgi:hypothetical protein
LQQSDNRFAPHGTDNTDEKHRDSRPEYHVSKYLAIDLAPEGVFVVAGTARGGQVKVEQALSWTDADGEAPPLLTAETAKRIGEQLRERLRAAGIGQLPALVSVGRGRVILKELRYPAVPPTEEPAIVKFQAMKELSDAPDDVVIDYTPLANGAPEGERRSMAVIIRKDLYSAIQQMCTAANLKLAAVTPRPYAIAAGLSRAFSTRAVEPPENKADAVATLSLGSAGGEFTVVRNGDVAFTRDVPGPVATSEPMLLGEVRRNLTMYAGSAPGHPIQNLYVAESAGGWASRLRAALGIPVSAYDPLNGSSPNVPETLRGRFAGAVGLLAARSADAVPINFAAPRQPRVAKDPKKTQLMLAAALVFVLLFGGAAFGFFALSSEDRKFSELQIRKTDLEDSIKKMEPDAKRLDAAKKWQGRRVNWLDELYEATSRMPKDEKFFVKSFEGKPGITDQKGNQPNGQGTITLNVVSRSLETVAGITEALHREPKFYSGITFTTGGFSREDSQAKEYTVFTRVQGRTPDQFTTTANFKAPSRVGYPARTVVTKPRTEETPPDETPPPRAAKKDTGAGADDNEQ